MQKPVIAPKELVLPPKKDGMLSIFLIKILVTKSSLKY